MVECSTAAPLHSLIGCREDHPALTKFLHHLPQQQPLQSPEKHTFEALKTRPPCVYHNYKALGISLCFENSVLQAIHLYNVGHGYLVYRGQLPYGLRMQMCAVDIVKLLGEPDGKMGGGRRGPISLAYKEKGLQFNFLGCDWEDKNNTLDSITVHQPIG
eukprot:c17966_g1_i1 orf=83-559(+)